MRELARTSTLTRPSQLRLPLSTLTATRPCSSMDFDTSEGSGLELPMQVVGGRLVVQYNASAGDFNNGKFTPYPATLSRARVSVEEAPVKVLEPSNEIFHYPNEI